MGITGKERLGLVGVGAAAAIASAFAVLVLDRAPSVDASLAAAEATTVVAQSISSASPKADRLQTVEDETVRFSYVPEGALALRASFEPGSDQYAETGENPDDIAAASWGADTSVGADWKTDVSAPVSSKPEASPIKASLIQPNLPTNSAVQSVLRPDRSLKERLSEISPAAMKRIKDKFEAANAPWPPADITLIGLKDKKVLDLYARSRNGSWQLIHRYDVLAASGGAGPKLRQGDKQVPEGIYSISFLNPNSRYHVSMRLNYPNEFDRQMAVKDGRKELGGDIMIHGKAVSVGCLAVGDAAAEELFVLAAETGLSHIKVIIAPKDFRREEVPQEASAEQPRWLPKLYTQVASAMNEFPKPPGSGLLSFFGN